MSVLIKALTVLAAVAALAVTPASTSGAHIAHFPGCRTHSCDVHQWHYFKRHKHFKHTKKPFHGLVVKGQTSVFGSGTSDGWGQTADGNSAGTARPCIAIRDDSTLGHWFNVTITVNGRQHSARLLHCDYGPATWTGRSIDITGPGAEALGFSGWNYPTDHAYGVAVELG